MSHDIKALSGHPPEKHPTGPGADFGPVMGGDIDRPPTLEFPSRPPKIPDARTLYGIAQICRHWRPDLREQPNKAALSGATEGGRARTPSSTFNALLSV